ncbi:hypothetical protein P0O24_00035 [Methanotrichaceae archaeon M04Ac]|uniref:DUF1616 domain-containing protein n=1 Tax=Candidatus Methanocrinis alkalitolerans TaxID=3033395 RepID=A0ABT5XB81_9EURY|nr:hypothetical protein [Candidatus Methanocrinis alkalitolerans]MDF0591975.1 hypothetical protein [Candidatus Methanocrinis alkalitolerans]
MNIIGPWFRLKRCLKATVSSLIFIAVIYTLLSMPIFKFGLYDTEIGGDFDPLQGLVVEVHGNFPLIPMFPTGGIIEVYLIPKDSNSKTVYGKGYYGSSDWVAYAYIENIERNKDYTVKLYHTATTRASVKELWLDQEIKLPLEGDLVLFRRTPGTGSLNYRFEETSAYFNITIKNYFNNMYKVKPVVYISDGIVKPAFRSKAMQN